MFSWLCGKKDEIFVLKHENDAACRWFITVWFMKFVIFLSRGWVDPNWALRRIAVHSVREKNRKSRHHNLTIIAFTQQLVPTTTPINRRHAIYLVPLRRWSQPRFIFSGELFLVKSTASWSSVREMPLVAADRVKRCQTTHAKKPYW